MKNRSTRLIVFLVLALGLTAAYAGTREVRPIKIPTAEKNRKSPTPASAETIAHGQLLFASQCVMCHGEKGDGKGDIAEKYAYPTPDFTDAEQQKARTDGELFYIVTHGHGKMPGEEKRMSEEWRWHLVHYVRSLAGTPDTP